MMSSFLRCLYVLKYNGLNKHKINMYKNCARSFGIFDPHMEPAHDQFAYKVVLSLLNHFGINQ